MKSVDRYLKTVVKSEIRDHLFSVFRFPYGFRFSNNRFLFSKILTIRLPGLLHFPARYTLTAPPGSFDRFFSLLAKAVSPDEKLFIQGALSQDFDPGF